MYEQFCVNKDPLFVGGQCYSLKCCIQSILYSLFLHVEFVESLCVFIKSNRCVSHIVDFLYHFGCVQSKSHDKIFDSVLYNNFFNIFNLHFSSFTINRVRYTSVRLSKLFYNLLLSVKRGIFFSKYISPTFDFIFYILRDFLLAFNLVVTTNIFFDYAPQISFCILYGSVAKTDSFSYCFTDYFHVSHRKELVSVSKRCTSVIKFQRWPCVGEHGNLDVIFRDFRLLGFYNPLALILGSWKIFVDD